MTSPDALYHSIKTEDTVVAVWFTKQQVEEHLATSLTDEQWANLADWFNQAGFTGEVEELFYSYVNRAVTE